MSVKGNGEVAGVEVEESAPGGVGQEAPQRVVSAEQPGEPVEVDPAEANIILDAVFSKGVYEEEVELSRGHKCVFATRTTKQAKEILSRLERDNPARVVRYDQLYGCYCLAASLQSFDGGIMPKSFDEKIAIIDTWSGPLVGILLDKLVKFDDKVAGAYTAEQVKN